MRKILYVLPWLLLSGCAVRASLAPGEIPAPPALSAEDRIGAFSAINSFTSTAGYPLSDNQEQQARLERIAGPLLAAAGYAPGTVPVKLVQSDGEANALALDGRAIVFFDGLLEKLPDDAEVATILAHEIGHLLGGHAKEADESERASAVSVASTVVGVLANVGLGLAGYAGAGQLAGDLTEEATSIVGYGAYVRAYDRAQEYEADQIGICLMAKSGYEPKTAIALWERAPQIFGDPEKSGLSFFSTHPESSDRAQRLEALLPTARALCAK